MVLSLSVSLGLCLGGLLSEPLPRHASLLDVGDVVLAQGGLPQAVLSADPEVLRTRLEALKSSTPSLGGPVALLVSGGVLVIGGVFFGYLGLLVLALSSSPVLLIPSLIGLAIGVALVVTGGVLLGTTLQAKKRRSREIRELEQELQRLETNQPGFTPPPMPPPSVQGPAPSLLLASF